MTESKHSPGPWAVTGSIEDMQGICIEATTLRDGPVRYHMCQGVGGQVRGEAYDDYSEVEANAKLIAASPDLMADLREAAATLRRYEELHRVMGTDDSTAKADVNAALAARFEATIAKATE